MEFSKAQLLDSLQEYKSRQENVLLEDIDTFEVNLKRYADFCKKDGLVQSILTPLQSKHQIDSTLWWKTFSSDERDSADLCLPENKDEEFVLRSAIINDVIERNDMAMVFGRAFNKYKWSEGKELFRNLIFRPYAEEMSRRIGKSIDLATPEERELQAVPIKFIPSANETRIFLSHKSVDKPLVKRYYQALMELGYSPWLDERNLLAGSNLERELLRGFEESCAAVFFITGNYKDEDYLASEVEYAIIQKRKKKEKFAIITLRFETVAEVPVLLQRYTYKTISNELDGFYELIRALPIQTGPIRWKSEVVKD